jgi:hypothetical protein
MQIKPLKVLLQELEQEMLRLGYSKGSMNFYRNRWQKLTEFARSEGEIYYSDFKEYRYTVADLYVR